VSLRDRLKRLAREGSFSRIRCEECGQGWLTREEVELRFHYAGWGEAMGMGPDPSQPDTIELLDHEHKRLVYEANDDPEMVGRLIFSEFPRNTPEWREHGF
jgi:hypothetical protein